MKHIIICMSAISALIWLSGCATANDDQVASYIKSHPKIVFDVIEEHPEEFMQVINKAARKAQESQQQKQMAEMQAQESEQIKNPLKPDLKSERRLQGPHDGKITIVEYADFQCPACRMAYSSLKEIKNKYKDQVQFYYKNMPLDFHKMAYPAALHYEAVAKQDRVKALKYYDYLFENQTQMHDEAFLKEAAKKVGADMNKLEADLKKDDIKKLIASDMEEFEKFGFTGTPVIMVNGVAMHGAQPAEEIERVIKLTKK